MYQISCKSTFLKNIKFLKISLERKVSESGKSGNRVILQISSEENPKIVGMNAFLHSIDDERICVTLSDANLERFAVGSRVRLMLLRNLNTQLEIADVFASCISRKGKEKNIVFKKRFTQFF